MVEGDMVVVEGVVLTMAMETTVVGVVAEDVGGAIPLVMLSLIGVVALYVVPMTTWHRIALIRVVVGLIVIMVIILPPLVAMHIHMVTMAMCIIVMEMDLHPLTKTAITTTPRPHHTRTLTS